MAGLQLVHTTRDKMRRNVAMRLVRVTGVKVFFFFQAEDGIRGRDVTGVQTCALPILMSFTTKRIAHGLDPLL